MRRFHAFWALPAIVFALAPGSLGLTASDKGPDLVLRTVADRLDSPVDVAFDPDHQGVCYVVEQGTRLVRTVVAGKVREMPFLDLSDRAGVGHERGLLAIELHPRFGENGRFYVAYTDLVGDSVVEEYRRVSVEPDYADPIPLRTILTVEQPAPVHNVDDLAFGPDGFLYVSSGDGGPGGDPHGAAQDPFVLRGKILRLEVDTRVPGPAPGNPFVDPSEGRPEIFALGLRNPWRMSFDRDTGDLWIGDVGQGTHEEIDLIEAGEPGGANFGWRCKEGTWCTGLSGCVCISGTLTAPLHHYEHQDWECAVIGGYVYRGSLLPQLQGAYLFGDWCTQHIRALRRLPRGEVGVELLNERLELDAHLQSIASFAEDPQGELYVVDTLRGAILRLEPAAGVTRYCDALPNSTGVSAQLSFEGSLSAADEDVRLRLEGALPEQATLFFYGSRSMEVPFGDGRLCVGEGPGGLHRFQPAYKADMNGELVHYVDFHSPPAGTEPGRFAAGRTWHLQAWYRDPAGAGGSGFNLSDALSLTLAP